MFIFLSDERKGSHLFSVFSKWLAMIPNREKPVLCPLLRNAAPAVYPHLPGLGVFPDSATCASPSGSFRLAVRRAAEQVWLLESIRLPLTAPLFKFPSILTFIILDQL